MISNLNSQPWKTSILHVEDGLVYISGGNHQGLRPGKELTVKQLGKQGEVRPDRIYYYLAR